MSDENNTTPPIDTPFFKRESTWAALVSTGSALAEWGASVLGIPLMLQAAGVDKETIDQWWWLGFLIVTARFISTLAGRVQGLFVRVGVNDVKRQVRAVEQKAEAAATTAQELAAKVEGAVGFTTDPPLGNAPLSTPTPGSVAEDRTRNLGRLGDRPQ